MWSMPVVRRRKYKNCQKELAINKITRIQLRRLLLLFKRCLSIFYYKIKTFSFRREWLCSCVPIDITTTKVSTLMFNTVNRYTLLNNADSRRKKSDNNGMEREFKIVKCNSAHNWGIIHCYLVTFGKQQRGYAATCMLNTHPAKSYKFPLKLIRKVARYKRAQQKSRAELVHQNSSNYSATNQNYT